MSRLVIKALLIIKSLYLNSDDDDVVLALVLELVRAVDGDLLQDVENDRRFELRARSLTGESCRHWNELKMHILHYLFVQNFNRL